MLHKRIRKSRVKTEDIHDGRECLKLCAVNNLFSEGVYFKILVAWKMDF